MSVYITKSLKAEMKADELYKLVQASLEDTICGESEEEERWETSEEKRKEQDRKKGSDTDRDRDRDRDERSDRNNVKSSRDKHKESKREKEERKKREKEERRTAKEDRKRHKEKKSNKKEKENLSEKGKSGYRDSDCGEQQGQSQTKMANDKIDNDNPIKTERSVPDGTVKTEDAYKEDGGLNVNTYSRQIDLHDEELISAVTNLQHSTPEIKLIEKEGLSAKTKRKSGSILSHTMTW